MPLTSLITPFCLIGRFPLQKILSLNQTTMVKVSKHLHSSTSASTTTTTDNNIRVYKRRVVAQQKKKDDLVQSQTGEDYESMTLQQLRTIPNISGGQNPDTPDPVSEVTRTEPKKRRRKTTVVDGGNALEGNSSNPLVAKSVSIMKKVVEKRKTSLVKKEEDVKIIGNSNEPWTILAHKKPQEGWVPYNPKLMRPPPLTSGNCVKLISWNVNGIRALQKTDGFAELAKREDFDILCLQETKLQEKNVEKLKESFLDGYEHSFWTCSVSKLGYSGSAIISRIKPVSVRYGLGILDHDTEGRIVTVEFDPFYLISGYVPNSGDGLKRLEYRITQWDAALANYMKELEKSKPVILTGDLNCAHQEIDIFSPATNRRSAGFTNEERESFEMNFLSRGFVDTFRRQHPGVVAYTFWGYRQATARITNKGWRLDYFLVSESIANKVHDSYILSDVSGSDHCPIGLILKL